MTTTPESDAARASDENRAALEYLYRTELDTVYGFLLVRSGSPHIAEYLATEVFIEAGRACAKGQADQIRTGWLITVAKRRLIDHWRQVKRQQLRLQELHQQVSREVANPVDDSADWRISDALDSLAVHQRAALTMRYLDGYSVSEIADSLNLSYRAAESLLARSRRSFHAAYQEATHG